MWLSSENTDVRPNQTGYLSGRPPLFVPSVQSYEEEVGGDVSPSSLRVETFRVRMFGLRGLGILWVVILTTHCVMGDTEGYGTGATGKFPVCVCPVPTTRGVLPARM